MERHYSHKGPVTPCHYNIETTAQLCGVLPVTLRAWQRYGLINPQRDENGSRWYSENDLTRLHLIVQKVNAGIPIAQIDTHLQSHDPAQTHNDADSPSRHNSNWRDLQAEILHCLGEGELQKLRRLVWRFGREYPASCLVKQVLRPIREFMSTSRQAACIQQRGLLDSIIIEYATFVMASSRKRNRPRVLLIPMQYDDSLELWLEALNLSGEGLNVELIRSAVSEPDLSPFTMEHYLIWSDSPLSERQRALYNYWLIQGLPVMLLGRAGPLLQSSSSRLLSPHPLNSVLVDHWIKQGACEA